MLERWYCRVCGLRLAYNSRKYTWRHVQAGVDHMPLPYRPASESELRLADGDR